jgi:hypothetical protein
VLDISAPPTHHRYHETGEAAEAADRLLFGSALDMTKEGCKMKTQKIAIRIAGSIAIALAHALALAQQPVITSFQGNGQLTWTNLPGTNGFTVQWAPAVTGAWFQSWAALDSLITTGSQTTVSVPMFYRVAQGFSPTSQRGVWILSGPISYLMQNASVYYIAQDDGIISESGAFIPRGPAGFFTVDSAGRVTNTLVLRHSPTIVIPGTFAGPNQIIPDPPYTNMTIRRVEDVSRCGGAWSGTLYQTNTLVGSPTSYPVSFNVDVRGLVTNFTGFPTNTIGRFFALTNGTAAGFFFTGSTDDYEQIRVSGTLSGNTITGTYENNSNYGTLGTVSLTRQ